ncbi:MAG TPA: hypothetical protein PLS69_00755 [Terricaulis sp.]|nr:hypothetical protein [Terricaulis sp.]HRP11499.1 hypothetical protein [Terricaulis sp.]
MWEAIAAWAQTTFETLNGIFSGDSAEEWIAFLGWIVAALTLILAFISFNLQKRRERRVELQENYLRLELESNEVFRFEAEHGEVLALYKEPMAPEGYDERWEMDISREQAESIADNFYLQQLNLFEIAARFRRDNVFADHIFGSWVIWYHDASRSWWFRKKWAREYSDNYTSDLYYIFTPMTMLFDEVAKKLAQIPDEHGNPMKISDDDGDPLAIPLKRFFFKHVSDLFHCPIVLEWLDREPNGAKWRAVRGAELFWLWLTAPFWKLSSRMKSWFRSPIYVTPNSVGSIADKILKASGVGSASASASTRATSPTAKSSNPSPSTESNGPPTPSS